MKGRNVRQCEESMCNLKLYMLNCLILIVGVQGVQLFQVWVSQNLDDVDDIGYVQEDEVCCNGFISSGWVVKLEDILVCVLFI